MTDNRTTELLCKLLEERGEDYMRNGFNITWSYYSDPHTATESIDGTLIVTGLTPEQAIAATLGNTRHERTCHDKNGFDHVYTHGFECTVCETTTDSYMHTTTSDEIDEQFNYCPNCGAKVVSA